MGKIILPDGAGKGAKIAAVEAMTKSVKGHLDGIAAHFDNAKITLIVRSDNGDLVFTNDETAPAIGALAAYEEWQMPYPMIDAGANAAWSIPGLYLGGQTSMADAAEAVFRAMCAAAAQKVN